MFVLRGTSLQVLLFGISLSAGVLNAFVGMMLAYYALIQFQQAKNAPLCLLSQVVFAIGLCVIFLLLTVLVWSSLHFTNEHADQGEASSPEVSV